MTKAQLKKYFKNPIGRKAERTFEGFSAYNENSTAASFHQAVQAAAKAAAAAAMKNGHTEPEWYQVSEVRILVGNPNVKVYNAVITKVPPTD